ncbi:MAG: hypothetical protein IT373_02240, partial [Polyangiaceae bacterium]|nr:hypothetical protein [Polyangiaceae bacterium]
MSQTGATPRLGLAVSFAAFAAFAALAAGACSGKVDDAVPDAGSTTTSTTSSGPSCPAEVPDGYVFCDPGPGTCAYELACQSGPVTLTFECTTGAWHIDEIPCQPLHDSCPGTHFHCTGTWYHGWNTDPPAPCPATEPAPGTPCSTGYLGGVWEQCGYYCADQPNVWTVVTCTGPGAGENTWQS